MKIEELLKGVKLEKLKDKKYFLEMYIKRIQAGEWRNREESELEEILENYFVYVKNEEILAGFGISDYKNGKIIECIFSDKKGFGSIILEEVKKYKNVYIFGKHEKFFTKSGYIKLNIFSNTGANLFCYSENT